MYVEMDKTKMETVSQGTDPISSLYKRKVEEFSNHQWFTISPDTRHYDKRSVMIAEWITKIHKWLYPSCHDYLFVLELDDERPHFHGVCDIKDHISFTSKYWSIKNSNNSRLHSEFKKGGLAYIFKDVEKTYKHTGVQPVYEYGDWVTSLQLSKDARQLKIIERRAHFLREEEHKTPDWMLHTSSDSE